MAGGSLSVATGEHEYTRYGFRRLISRGGADIVQPDVGRVGGVTEWMKVAHMAHGFDLPVAPHSVQLVHLHPDWPVFHGRTATNGRPTTYVCRSYACKLPTTDPDVMLSQLPTNT